MSKDRELLQKVLHLHTGSGHPGAFVVENLMNEIRDYLYEKEKFEVVMWQSRCRSATFDKKDNWYPWEECTKEQAEDYKRVSFLHEWEYESRALYIKLSE